MCMIEMGVRLFVMEGCRIAFDLSESELQGSASKCLSFMFNVTETAPKI